jgi:hypothetical protein|eukprot:COSAG01_NODE_4726_length_4789_cov_12.625160_3_plen_42_part_00
MKLRMYAPGKAAATVFIPLVQKIGLYLDVGRRRAVPPKWTG